MKYGEGGMRECERCGEVQEKVHGRWTVAIAPAHSHSAHRHLFHPWEVGVVRDPESWQAVAAEGAKWR